MLMTSSTLRRTPCTLYILYTLRLASIERRLRPAIKIGVDTQTEEHRGDGSKHPHARARRRLTYFYRGAVPCPNLWPHTWRRMTVRSVDAPMPVAQCVGHV